MSEVRQLDLITVAPVQAGHHCGVLTAGQRHMPCALGRAGVTDRKREGDGASPAGTWPLRYVLFRPDRVDRPTTGLAVQAWHRRRLVRRPADPATTGPFGCPTRPVPNPVAR
jgi:L,D-peptidoglycan transpeptidase YkuD (ErfK/YbiS/YcfS/YnhG family)